VRNGFLALAAAHPERFRVVVAEGSEDEVFGRVIAALDGVLT
jgi:thymidylate kinase